MILDQSELQKLIKKRGIKTTEDLNSFMNEFTKEVVESLYEGEITDHLGHEKNQRKTEGSENVRNGYSSKIVKSKHGEIKLEVPRDREEVMPPRLSKSVRMISPGWKKKSSPCLASDYQQEIFKAIFRRFTVTPCLRKQYQQ